MTGSAFVLQCKFQFLLHPKYCFLKGNPYTGADIGPFHGAAAPSSASTAAAEEIPENISENIPEISAVKIETTKTACPAFKCRMPKLVILTLLLRVTKHGICFRSFFKLLFRLFIPRIHVRVIFFG